MRKPHDIDAEIKARKDQIKTLKALRVRQFGELVVATGADALDHEILAGVLLAAMEAARDAGAREAWRRKGAQFFQGAAARDPNDRAEHIGHGPDAGDDRATAG